MSTTTKKTAPRKRNVKTLQDTGTPVTPLPTTPEDKAEVGALNLLSNYNGAVEKFFTTYGSKDPAAIKKALEDTSVFVTTARLVKDKIGISEARCKLLEQADAKLKAYFKANPVEVKEEDSYYEPIDYSYLFANTDTLSVVQAYLLNSKLDVTEEQMETWINISMALCFQDDKTPYYNYPFSKVIMSKDGTVAYPEGVPVTIEHMSGTNGEDGSINQGLYIMNQKSAATSLLFTETVFKNAIAVYSFFENINKGGTTLGVNEYKVSITDWNLAK